MADDWPARGLGFELTDEQGMLREMVHDFVERECPKLVARDLEASHEFPYDLMARLAAAGLFRTQGARGRPGAAGREPLARPDHVHGGWSIRWVHGHADPEDRYARAGVLRGRPRGRLRGRRGRARGSRPGVAPDPRLA